MSNACEDKYGGHKWTTWHMASSATEDWEQRECQRCNITPETRRRRRRLFGGTGKGKKKR